MLKEIFDRLNGRTIIIRGNHDRSITSLLKMGWEVHKQPFPFIKEFGILKDIVLTHTPVVDTLVEGSLSLWKDDINICGHVHDSWKRKGNSYNVGVDVWNFRPVSLDEILEDT